MKKILSVILTALMAFSVLTVGAASASAAEQETAAPALEAGSKIFFDNTNTKWENVYFYAWNYGYFGDSVPMTKVPDSNLYSVVVPVDVPDGAEYFLFKSMPDWSGAQTANQTVTAGFNTYTPVFDATGAMTVEKSNTKYDVEPTVAITPYSKSFTNSIDVTVYAFNAQSASYKLGDDGESVPFTGSATITLTDTTKVIVTADTATTSCEFTKIPDALITVDAGAYTGNMYVYTYGGDRVAPGFAPMVSLGDGKYTYTLNGSAHVIFTTADNWTDAKKFLICDEEGNPLENQEPFVNYGEHPSYILDLLVE